MSTHPEDPGEARLQINLTELEVEGGDVEFEIPVQHLDRLIERLTVERNRARFLAGATVHAAVAS